MTKKIISLILTLILVFSLAAPAFAETLEQTPATDKDIQASVDALAAAVSELQDVFSDKQAKGVIDTFIDFANTLKNASSYIAAINGGVTFLKLIGLVKDGNAEMLSSIMEQMTIIGEQITDMDRKLDRLTEEMSKLQASVEFNARIENAFLLETSWKDFEYRYMENGLDDLLTQYNSMMLTGLQLWCRNEGRSRIVDGMDNTSLVLAYDSSENKLIYSRDNGRPECADENARILVLDSDVLPQSISWNVNTYRDSIKNAIVKSIKDKIAADGPSSFSFENFPEFETGDGLTDELIYALAEDAVNLLTYRVTAAQVNANSEFSLQLVRQFSNYCTHLLSSKDGIDAITKALFLTHAFEYQVADDYKNLYNQMAVKTGVYGSFVLNVLGMSDYVTNAEISSALSSYCHTLTALSKAKAEGLTGNGNFCYITNKKLFFGTASFTDKAEIKSNRSGMNVSYESCKTNDTVTGIYYGKYDKSSSAEKLIGDTDAILLQYYLSSNGIKPDFSFYNEKLGQNAARDYGSIVVSIVGPQSLPLNDSTSLKVSNVVGSYFSGKASTKLSSLPSGADSDYIASRRMMKGSLMNTASGGVTANSTLSALAIYGESHWYWEKDEAAFLGGPAGNNLTSSCTKERTGTEFPATEIYTYRYSQTVSYNCLINEAVSGLLSDSNGSSVLSSYAELCKEIRDNIKDAPEEIGSDDTPGENTTPDTPSAPADEERASEDTAIAPEDTVVIPKDAVLGSAISESAKDVSEDTSSFERALPWIIGGAAVIALAAIVLMKTSKNRRG